MKHFKSIGTILLVLTFSLFLVNFDCTQSVPANTPVSSSGVQKQTVTVKTDLNGHTIEQNNVAQRLAEDNQPGAVKHLYIISAYSGQTLIYSTVKGKVTSSGKRLTPVTVAASQSSQYDCGVRVDIDGNVYRTSEVLQDDGTYGSSVEYLYWWDTKGIYHQQYVTGGMILHISSQPLAGVKSVVLNMELTKPEPESK